MTTDPMLEAIYGRARKQEVKRAEKQAKFDKAIADGELDADGVPTGKLVKDTNGH
jgi:hypothetical protein